jgi:hypothetical protein
VSKTLDLSSTGIPQSGRGFGIRQRDFETRYWAKRLRPVTEGFWKRTAAGSLLRSITLRPRSAPEEATSRCKRRARSAGRPADPTGDDPSVVHEVLSSILAQGRPRHLGESPLVLRAEEFGQLGWASLLSLFEPPGPLLLFPGIFRHATRRGSRFARRLFPAQFFGLGGRQVQDDLVVGGDLPHATHRQA